MVQVFTWSEPKLIALITQWLLDVTIGGTAPIATRRQTIIRGGKYFIRDADVSIKYM